MSANWLKDKQNVAYPCNGLLLDNKKQWRTRINLENKMLGERRHKRSHIINPSVRNVHTHLETETRLIVAWECLGWGKGGVICERRFRNRVSIAKRVTLNRVRWISKVGSRLVSSFNFFFPVLIFKTSQNSDFCQLQLDHLLECIVLLWLNSQSLQIAKHVLQLVSTLLAPINQSLFIQNKLCNLVPSAYVSLHSPLVAALYFGFCQLCVSQIAIPKGLNKPFWLLCRFNTFRINTINEHGDCFGSKETVLIDCSDGCTPREHNLKPLYTVVGAWVAQLVTCLDSWLVKLPGS